MTFLGLELSDAGIIVAGGNPWKFGGKQGTPVSASSYPQVLGSIEYGTPEAEGPACSKSC